MKLRCPAGGNCGEGQKVANRKIELIFLQRFRILQRDRASISRNPYRRWLDLSRLGTAL